MQNKNKANAANNGDELINAASESVGLPIADAPVTGEPVAEAPSAGVPSAGVHGDLVEWQDWEAACDSANSAGKPIFLVIGYKGCTGLDAMRRESFSNKEIAALLNRAFVPVLIDNELRPELDALYQLASRALNGRGGWPVTAILLPQGQPFYAGGYFPREGDPGSVGLMELITSVEEGWRETPGKLRRAAEVAAEQMKLLLPSGKTHAGSDTVFCAVEALKRAYDDRNAGFGGGHGSRPKFPLPHRVQLMLEYSQRYEDREAREMAMTTLYNIYYGACFDHIGGGFFRCCVDEAWQLPRFEKRLSDNALLISLYIKAYAVKRDEAFKSAALRALEYADKRLWSGKAYYESEDAYDSGSYYIDRGFLTDVLGEPDALRFGRYYSIT